MFDCEVSDDFMKTAKDFIARLAWGWLLRIDPGASHFLLDRLSEVTVECSRSSVMSCHSGHAVHVSRVHLIGGTHLVLGPVSHSCEPPSLHRIMQSCERIRSCGVKSGGEHCVTSGCCCVMCSVNVKGRNVASEHGGVSRRMLTAEVPVLTVGGHLRVHPVGRGELQGSCHGCTLNVGA